MKPVSLFLLSAALLAAAPRAPDWLEEAATSALPTYDAKVAAVVLMNQEEVTVEDALRKTTTIRYAVRILNREGSREAAQGVPYYNGAGKVRDAKAWLIMPSGTVREYGKRDVVDANLVSGVYDDLRYQSISARTDADPGSVFGFEATVEEKTAFSQFVFDFQDELPALRSTFVLHLPPGWTAEGSLWGGGKLPVKTAENTYTWQLTALPPYEREPNSPSLSSLLPRLVVSTFPPEGIGDGVAGHFRSWREVSEWTSRLVDPSVTVTPAIESRVQSLTQGASDFWDKLKPLAEEAQKIRYISIQMNVARGGGYTPHPASEVLRNAYGDCKDKANYLRTLLRAAGIDSYLVTIYSGDPRHTRREWPSPEQFNHAILAIRAPAEVKNPAAFDFPGLGHLLLFDPTDQAVPLGYLPDDEQNALALLLAGDKGDLFQVPATAPEANLLTRTVRLKLDREGRVANGRIEDVGIGQAAFDLIGLEQRYSGEDFDKRVERRVARAVTGAQVSNIEPKEDGSRAEFRLKLDFTAPGYARLMQSRLMIFKPVVLPYSGLPDVVSPKRVHPLVVDPAAFDEHVEVELPEGFSVDELPDSESIESPYGKYSATWKINGGVVDFDRHLELFSSVVPPSDYHAARDFFANIGGTEQAPVVLVKR